MAVGLSGILYFILLLFPQLLFANKIAYKQFVVYSDKPIDANITNILDDATSRISKSVLYESAMHFKVFICNDIRRFMFFTVGNKNAGAVTFNHFTNNIFFGPPCDIANNKIIPPDGSQFAKYPFSFSDRSLAYYFAHEVTHVLQSHYLGKLNFSAPTWLSEGYADYIGKGDDFDFNANLKMLPNLTLNKGFTGGIIYMLHT